MEELEYSTDIAIIGLDGRFPGARNIEEFWQNLHDGVESVTFFSDQELLDAGVDPSQLTNPNYVGAGAVLDDVDKFDAAFFGISAREAALMDPQQRLFLECAWGALEHAGYDTARSKERIGVFAGASMNLYLLANLSSHRQLLVEEGNFNIGLSNEKDYLTTKTAYRLNLKGPSISVSTGCSTSLVSIHLAVQSLLSGECDMALAGGVAVKVPQKDGYLYQEGGIGSPDGHCRVFDRDAQGTIRGDGVGVVVLKKLSRALEEHDTVHAIIKGSAVNNDGGDKIGFTAPGIDGQATVISDAQMIADVSPEMISYIEAHGTGTPLGDPIELTALSRVFHQATKRKHFCAIGSVKSNIGHLDAAAGISGLIKTVLMLQHKQLVPSLHYVEPNPRIDFANSAFYVNTRLQEWSVQDHPRIAGVSSFGIGGTNVHIILQEAPLPPSTAPMQRPWQILTLSAKTPGALAIATQELATSVRKHPEYALADIAYTLQVGRRQFEYCGAFPCQDREEAIQGLSSPTKHNFQRRSSSSEVVFLFPGQGSQHVDMARGLYEHETVFRQVVDYCAEVSLPLAGYDIRQILFPTPQHRDHYQEQLKQTSVTQLALFTIEYALAQQWIAWGVHPQASIGHSIGEYVAACLSGVFHLKDALHLVILRGRMMQSLSGGDMLSIPLPSDALQPLLSEELSLAVINTPQRCVVSGKQSAIQALEERLTQDGIRSTRLHTSHAFHSAMMEPIVDSFAREVGKLQLQVPAMPFISNLTGTWIMEAEAIDPYYWARQLRQTVRFSAGVQLLLAHADYILLEVGPGTTLSALCKQHVGRDNGQLILSSLPHPQGKDTDMFSVARALSQLWMYGVPVDWSKYVETGRRRVALPTYPFERQSYWIAAYRPEIPQKGVDSPVAMLSDVNLAGKETRSDAFSAVATSRVSNNKTSLKRPFNIESTVGRQLEVMAQQLDLLQQGKKTRRKGVTTSDNGQYQAVPTRQPDMIPLTPIQQWFFEQPVQQRHYWNQSVMLEIKPSIVLEPAILYRALHILVMRHDALRLRFVEDVHGWQQYCSASEDVVVDQLLDVYHLEALAGDAQKARMQELTIHAQTSLDLSHGPLIKAALFETGPENVAVVVLVIHHLAVDMMSWDILLADLQQIYQQLKDYETVQLLPKSSTFQAWSKKLHAYAQSEKLQQEVAYWLARPWSGVTSMHPDLVGGHNLQGTVHTVSATILEEETTALFSTLSKAVQVQPHEILLTALAYALKRRVGGDIVLIDIEGHGREDVLDGANLLRTVGWFTSLVPACLQLRDDAYLDWVASLKTIKQQLRAMPDGGIGFGLLRYLSQDKELRQTMQALPKAEVVFNFDAHPRGMKTTEIFIRQQERLALDYSVNEPRSHLLAINGTVLDGRLLLHIDYSDQRHYQETIEQLLKDCCDILHAMIIQA